jgi:chaperonin GroEL (HSP60 family)
MPQVRRRATPKKENASRQDAFTKAQRNNLDAALLLVSVIRTALGPRGSYKMFLKKDNFVRPVMVTKDGYEALNRMEVEHPAAKVLVDAGKWIDLTVGDGSVSMLLLTGALLQHAEELMRKQIHPSTIIDGYARASEKAQEVMRSLALKFDPEDRIELVNLARSCIETKLSAAESAYLAPLVAEAAEKVKEYNYQGIFIDPDQVDIVKKTGGTIGDSELINGIALFREPTSGTMPREVHGAKIAFIGETLKLRIRKTAFKPEIQIDTPEQMSAFKEEEQQMMMEKVRVILRTGANVIISKESFDDHVQITLGRMGIMAIRRAMPVDIERLARATGGRIIPEIEAITPQDIGYAEHISVRNLEGDNWLFVEGCKDPKAVTMLIRGSSSNAVEAAGSAVRCALYSIERAARDPAVFPGGGALEAELARRLKRWAYTLHGKEQLAALKYAEALESIPTMLAESCGLNPLDALLEMRRAHASGSAWFGVDVENRQLAEMQDRGVIDIITVKSQVVKTATEVAMLMIRVDGVFTKPKWKPPGKALEMPAHRASPNQRVPGFHYGEARQFLPETW